MSFILHFLEISVYFYTMSNLRENAYVLAVTLGDQVRERVEADRPMYKEALTQSGMSRVATGHNSLRIKGQNWANMDISICSILSGPTLMFMTRNIVPALKMLNLLWHWPITKRSERTAINELIDYKILFRTQTIGIYIVNPVYIWKGGTTMLCIETTKKLLMNNRTPHTGLIHDLRASGEYADPDKYTRMLNGEGFDSNLIPVYAREQQSKGPGRPKL